MALYLLWLSTYYGSHLLWLYTYLLWLYTYYGSHLLWLYTYHGSLLTMALTYYGSILTHYGFLKRGGERVDGGIVRDAPGRGLRLEQAEAPLPW